MVVTVHHVVRQFYEDDKVSISCEWQQRVISHVRRSVVCSLAHIFSVPVINVCPAKLAAYGLSASG